MGSSMITMVELQNIEVGEICFVQYKYDINCEQWD